MFTNEPSAQSEQEQIEEFERAGMRFTEIMTPLNALLETEHSQLSAIDEGAARQVRDPQHVDQAVPMTAQAFTSQTSDEPPKTFRDYLHDKAQKLINIRRKLVDAPTKQIDIKGDKVVPPLNEYLGALQNMHTKALEKLRVSDDNSTKEFLKTVMKEISKKFDQVCELSCIQELIIDQNIKKVDEPSDKMADEIAEDIEIGAYHSFYNKNRFGGYSDQYRQNSKGKWVSDGSNATRWPELYIAGGKDNPRQALILGELTKDTPYHFQHLGGGAMIFDDMRVNDTEMEVDTCNRARVMAEALREAYEMLDGDGYIDAGKVGDHNHYANAKLYNKLDPHSQTLVVDENGEIQQEWVRGQWLLGPDVVENHKGVKSVNVPYKGFIDLVDHTHQHLIELSQKLEQTNRPGEDEMSGPTTGADSTELASDIHPTQLKTLRRNEPSESEYDRIVESQKQNNEREAQHHKPRPAIYVQPKQDPVYLNMVLRERHVFTLKQKDGQGTDEPWELDKVEVAYRALTVDETSHEAAGDLVSDSRSVRNSPGSKASWPAVRTEDLHITLDIGHERTTLELTDQKKAELFERYFSTVPGTGPKPKPEFRHLFRKSDDSSVFSTIDVTQGANPDVEKKAAVLMTDITDPEQKNSYTQPRECRILRMGDSSQLNADLTDLHPNTPVNDNKVLVTQLQWDCPGDLKWAEFANRTPNTTGDHMTTHYGHQPKNWNNHSLRENLKVLESELKNRDILKRTYGTEEAGYRVHGSLLYMSPEHPESGLSDNAESARRSAQTSACGGHSMSGNGGSGSLPEAGSADRMGCTQGDKEGKMGYDTEQSSTYDYTTGVGPFCNTGGGLHASTCSPDSTSYPFFEANEVSPRVARALFAEEDNDTGRPSGA